MNFKELLDNRKIERVEKEEFDARWQKILFRKLEHLFRKFEHNW